MKHAGKLLSALFVAVSLVSAVGCASTPQKEGTGEYIDDTADIIILNSVLSGKQEIVQSLRFEKGLENVLFLIYQ